MTIVTSSSRARLRRCAAQHRWFQSFGGTAHAVAAGLTILAFGLVQSVVPAGMPVSGGISIRDIRVLIADDVVRFRLRSAGAFKLFNDQGHSLAVGEAGSWTIVERAGAQRLRWNGQNIAGAAFRVEGDAARWELAWAGDHGWLDTLNFPGMFKLYVREDGMEVVNELDIEQYVTCVTSWEAWPTFHDEALRAQAVVTRSFALYQMLRRQNAAWDLAASQGAQVYRGERSDEIGRRAGEAAQDTRGVVCAWEDGAEERLFSTYYSAACGGISQSAEIFGAADKVPPLAGGVECDYCRIAPKDTYRWGPVRIPVRDGLARIVARYPDAAALRQITRVEVLERAPRGRVVRIRMHGVGGQTFDMLAEQFRLALGGSVIRSTWSDVRVEGNELVFENGKGYGHGLGLCQWGTEGQAVAGRRAGEILRYYFPGCSLARVY